MKTLIRVSLGLLLLTASAQAEPTSTEEMWKGSPYDHNLSLAILQGIGFPSGSVGYAVNGYLGIKLLHQGFVPDINDQVFGELFFGGLFGGGDGINFGAQLRWDIHKDYLWTFYGVGGLGVGIYGTAPARTTRFFPRVGVGALWNLFEGLSFRAEVTESLIGVGVATAF
jgi:hypothetical protein